MAAALAALMLVAPHEYGGGIAFIDIALALGVLAAAAVFGVVVVSETWRLFLPAAAILAALVYGGLFERTLGGAEDLNVSPRLAAAVRTAGWTPGTPIAAAGYQEPSLVFLTATDIELVGDGAEAAAFLRLHPGGYAIVEAATARPSTRPPPASARRQVATVSGFNYSRGQRVEITIFRAPLPSPRHERRRGEQPGSPPSPRSPHAAAVSVSSSPPASISARTRRNTGRDRSNPPSAISPSRR
ncbi:MAG: hypothetical protein U1F24_00700 [Alphaproteobacteria bacterium]